MLEERRTSPKDHLCTGQREKKHEKEVFRPWNSYNHQGISNEGDREVIGGAPRLEHCLDEVTIGG